MPALHTNVTEDRGKVEIGRPPVETGRFRTKQNISADVCK